MGVWIETEDLDKLKKANLVTPFVGVWIETWYCMPSGLSFSVTPFVGVWIETYKTNIEKKDMERHTLRGCVD